MPDGLGKGLAWRIQEWTQPFWLLGLDDSAQQITLKNSITLYFTFFLCLFSPVKIFTCHVLFFFFFHLLLLKKRKAGKGEGGREENRRKKRGERKKQKKTKGRRKFKTFCLLLFKKKMFFLVFLAGEGWQGE